MPIKPVDYSNTHFYKIVCKDLSINDCYVGHTTNFKNRKNNHKKASYNPNIKDYTMPLYQFIRKNGGWENFDMILINIENCKNSLEARSKERQYIEELNAQLNVRTSVLTEEEKKQWFIDNEEHLNNYRKEYYTSNRSLLINKQKALRENYTEEQKEATRQNQKTYRENNKDKIKALAGKVIFCQCGRQYTHQNKLRHQRSNKHQEYLKTLEPVD